MAKVPVTLQTTEVISGVKRRPGDVVELEADDPIAVKTRELEKAAVPAAKAKSGGHAG